MLWLSSAFSPSPNCEKVVRTLCVPCFNPRYFAAFCFAMRMKKQKEGSKMNHREYTGRQSRTRATQKQRGILASIRPKVVAAPTSRHVSAGDRVQLKIEDCSPAGVKMFMYRYQVIPQVANEELTTLSNGVTFKTKDITRLLNKAGISPLVLVAPPSW